MMVTNHECVAFAANEFSKIYYPYGIILRRSIPTSWTTYIRQRAPISLFFLGAWSVSMLFILILTCRYFQREYSRSERIDLTSDTEQ